MHILEPNQVNRIAVIGAGTIGASWAAQFLARGIAVTVSDPAPDTESRVRSFVQRAWPTLERIGMATGADPTAIQFFADPAAAVRDAQFVQESAPENLDAKVALYRHMEQAMPPNTVVATSTSGLLITQLQAGRIGPQRYVVGHPFNPPHIMPLVEVVGGEQTDPAVVDWAMAFYTMLGKHTIRINKEVPGHVANRLQAAIIREAFHLVESGVATVEDIDAAVAYGPGLRWALMGPNLILHLSGGEGGLRHALDHLGPALETWWLDLGAPHITADLASKLMAGVQAEVSGRPIADLARQRDTALVALLETVDRSRQELSDSPPAEP